MCYFTINRLPFFLGVKGPAADAMDALLIVQPCDEDESDDYFLSFS
jgi:hypothetical protein